MLWDLERDPPALLRPGTEVRFRAVPRLPAMGSDPGLPASVAPPAPEPDDRRGLVVVRPGILTTVQDAGRPGLRALGVTGSGAADRAAYEAANVAVGNPPGAAVLEATLGGLRVRALGDQILAVTGAAAPLTVRHPDGTATQASTVFVLIDGDVLELGTPPSGLRSYLAVRGGIDVPEVLHSRATDLLSGVGPAPLTRGQFLSVAGTGRDVSVSAGGVALPAPGWDRPGGTVRLTVTAGPHLDRVAPDAMGVLTGQEWQVTPQSNRVGLRLSGAPIGTVDVGELPSTPMVAGAIQVPPSGLPVVFLRDHPTTGGYPVPAVLTDVAIDLAGQLRPGQPVRFVTVEQT